MKRNKNTPTSYRIAHYLGLTFLVGLTICIIIWAFISRYNTPGTPHTLTKQMTECEQNVTNAISQMWAYNQELIPPKYTHMAKSYANETITKRTTGFCNDSSFTCRPGQRRSICDPCANRVGRQIALDAHIADTIKTTCNNTK